jgi:hypothetical protein
VTSLDHPTPSVETIRRYGRRGSSIPGSRLVRDYCWYCGQPMRALGRAQRPMCTDCMSPNVRSSVGPIRGEDIDTNGYYSNARRALEGD